MGFCFDLKSPAQGWNVRREVASARSPASQYFRIRVKSFAHASLMFRFYIGCRGGAAPLSEGVLDQ